MNGFSILEYYRTNLADALRERGDELPLEQRALLGRAHQDHAAILVHVRERLVGAAVELNEVVALQCDAVDGGGLPGGRRVVGLQ